MGLLLHSWPPALQHRLLPLDQDLWDLVIVHELLHLCVPNHGRLWKALMRAHLGEWESAAARLPRLTRRVTSPSSTTPAPEAIAREANPASPGRLNR